MADLLIPVYFDTCLFIELLQRDDPDKLDACEELRSKAVAKELLIVTSTVTITEVNKIPGSPDLPKEQSNQILTCISHINKEQDRVP